MKKPVLSGSREIFEDRPEAAEKVVERDGEIMVHKRFFVALLLLDVVNEVPMPKVEKRYGVQRGAIQYANFRKKIMTTPSKRKIATSGPFFRDYTPNEVLYSGLLNKKGTCLHLVLYIFGFWVPPALYPLQNLHPPSWRADVD